MLHPDISHHHPVTNWNKLESQCDFLICKATEGTKFIDSSVKSFIKECEQRKIPYWLYTFLDNGNELAQAKFMVKVCKLLVGKYFIGYVLDIESGNSEANCKDALKYIKTQSTKTMIYTMYGKYDKYKDLIKNRGEDCAWWEARYGVDDGKDNHVKSPCHSGVDLHQFTSKGKVNCLQGDIDLNRLTGTKDVSWFMTKGKVKKKESKDNKGIASKSKDSKPNESENVKNFQSAYNKDFSPNIDVDGIKGEETKKAIKKCGVFNVNMRTHPNVIKYIQKRVGTDADAIYGTNTVKKVKEYQKKHGLQVDGTVGYNTLNKMVS